MQAEKTESTLFNTLTEKEKANILSFSIDYMFMKNEEKLALIERISKFSGVQDKLLADISYLKGISGTGMQMEKGNPESSFEVNVMNVSTNFFQFMNIPLLSGHTLKAKEDLVVDKTWAERQKKDLLGTILYNYSESYTICGVCDDFIADVYNQSPGFVFLPSDFNYYVGHCYLKCEPGKTAEIKKMIEKTLKETLPESIHPHVTTLQEDIYEAQAKGSSYPEGKWSRIETDYFIVCPPLYKTADCFRNYCISINLYSHTNMEKSIYCIL